MNWTGIMTKKLFYFPYKNLSSISTTFYLFIGPGRVQHQV